MNVNLWTGSFDVPCQVTRWDFDLENGARDRHQQVPLISVRTGELMQILLPVTVIEARAIVLFGGGLEVVRFRRVGPYELKL